KHCLDRGKKVKRGTSSEDRRHQRREEHPLALAATTIVGAGGVGYGIEGRKVRMRLRLRLGRWWPTTRKRSCDHDCWSRGGGLRLRGEEGEDVVAAREMVADDWEEKRQRKGWGTATIVIFGAREAKETEGEGSGCGRRGLRLHVAGKKRAARSSESCCRGDRLLAAAGGVVDAAGQWLAAAAGKEEEKGRSTASAAVCHSREGVRLL
ncbi:hypothetical protein GW17_00011481, partial [Ensete ventricosum]